METFSTQTLDSFAQVQTIGDYNYFKDVWNFPDDQVTQAPQEPCLCPILSAELFENLRILEKETRPNFLKVHSDRALCVDWLVCMAEEYGFVKDPEALYLAVNYLDRYLYGNHVESTESLLIIGTTCLMIAIKYEQEVCIPPLNDYVFLAENRFSAQEFIELEYNILTYLDFEMTTPTAWCFVVRYLSIARDEEGADCLFDGPRLDSLAKYLTWLSLFSHSVLCYLPSMIAASSVFLAKYILLPKKTPWNEALVSSNMPTIKDKYARLVDQYRCVEFENCPCSIPHEYFKDRLEKKKNMC